MSDLNELNCGADHWREEEIVLERDSSDPNETTLRFADRNKRLKLHDIALRVNDSDLTNVNHQQATDILRTTGKVVHLLIRRLSPSNRAHIELSHDGKLGLTIRGGIGCADSSRLPSDPGIFIMEVDKTQTNEQLAVGDRLLQISSPYATYDLRFVTHYMARELIRLACARGNKVKLDVGHRNVTPSVPRQRSVLTPPDVSPDPQSPSSAETTADHADNKITNDRYVQNQQKKNCFKPCDFHEHDLDDNAIQALQTRVPKGRRTARSKGSRTISFAATPTVIEFPSNSQTCNRVNQARNATYLTIDQAATAQRNSDKCDDVVPRKNRDGADEV